jgi:TRAP-type C4-dicarboxylate transport system permease small subunit
MADPAETSEPDFADFWRTGGAFTTAIHGLFGGAAGILLFALMVVTMVDVVGRYVFSAPLPGGNEIVQILMAAVIYTALPSVCRQEAHITVDLLDRLTPRPLIPLRQIVMNAVGVVVLGVICWCLWLLAERLHEDHETWEYLLWERAPVVYFMCVLSGIGALIFLANLVRYLRGARDPKPGFI